MTYGPEREVRGSDVPPTKPMLERRSNNGAWMAALVIAAVLVAVGYFYLQPDVPSPNMRATDTAPVTAPETSPKSN